MITYSVFLNPGRELGRFTGKFIQAIFQSFFEFIETKAEKWFWNLYQII